MKRKAFTLAEVLITLAIIGVVAAVSIPSVISNSQQQEFKTGLRKAVSVLNSAITMNMATDGETPYDNANLFGYLQKHMSVMKSTTNSQTYYYTFHGAAGGTWDNAVFYTTDGMRFDFRSAGQVDTFPLHENSSISACAKNLAGIYDKDSVFQTCGGCGSYGLKNNPNNTTKPPCLITVDVNGDRKPNPNNAKCMVRECASDYKYSTEEKLGDIYTIMITENTAIPYGVAAQKAMYQARKR
ncbi:MAG: type II secretion system protein [bacterium]|nr:type II secretion system protein [bacterium]